MGIYHLHLQNISRGSGRSAIGAAAYRSAEKLRAVEKAAYRAGLELKDEDEQTYDYTQKGGVVHKEIILPENAPPEYKDRETLWNAVDTREKRKDARLAKEIDLALPTEFDLKEQIEVLREYIKENFTNKGVIVDLNIHNTGNGNPHAHIMLTTRHVTPEGFGEKNLDLDSRTNLLIWRESWAEINNRKFEEKGIEERIDHRTLKAQGLDREPTIHMGHEAWALEKKGVRTEKGEYNREIKRRNEERAAKTEPEKEFSEKEASLNNVRSAPKNNHADAERDALMSAKRGVREIEEHLKAEKAAQIVENMREQRKERELAEIMPRMDEIENEFFLCERELRDLNEDCIKIKRDIPPLEYRAEIVEEYAEVVEEKRKKLERPREERQKARLWEFEKKSYWDGQIRQTEQEFELARQYFSRKFKIEPEQAQEEIERLQKIIRKKVREIEEKETRMNKIYDRQDVLRTEYHALKLRRDLYRDDNLIRAHAEYWIKEIDRQNREAQAVRDRQIWERIEHRLNTISDKDFQKALARLPYEEAQTLAEMRELIRERERFLESEKERNRTIERSR